MAEGKKDAKKQIPLRLSAKLYAAIAAWAEDDFRSVNGQIEYLLTECVRQRKKNGKYVSDELDVPPELDLEYPGKESENMDIHRGKKVGVWLSVAAVLAPLAVQIAGVAWIWTLLGSHPLFWVLALLLTAAAVAVIVAACARIREINGGEEDGLSQY